MARRTTRVRQKVAAAGRQGIGCAHRDSRGQTDRCLDRQTRHMLNVPTGTHDEQTHRCVWQSELHSSNHSSVDTTHAPAINTSFRALHRRLLLPVAV
jgi:hypothetical protein